MDFTQSMDNGYMIPSSVAVGSGEATDIRCVCDTVEDFKAFLDATGMDLKYEGLVTYEKVNKRLMVYEGNDNWKALGEGTGSIDTSNFITLAQLSQQLNNYYTKTQADLDSKIEKIKTFEQYNSFYNSMIKGTANPLTALNIKTYEGGKNQPTHPKVLYFKNGWNGHKYWMCYTPYPNNNNDEENPCITYSDDGYNWSEVGISNPIDRPVPKNYFSDPHLVYREDTDTLECWYRECNNDRYSSDYNKEMIWRMTSTDGLTWGNKQELFTYNDKMDSVISPSIIYDEGKYKIWIVYKRQSLKYYESVDGTNWEYIRDIQVNPPDNFKVWHFDIIKTSKGYEFVGCYQYNGKPDGNNYIYYSKSSDNITYSYPVRVLANGPTDSFDDLELYRPCLLEVENKYMMYYGAQKNIKIWSIGLVETPSMELLNALLVSNTERKNALKNIEDRIVALENGTSLPPSPPVDVELPIEIPTDELVLFTSSAGITNESANKDIWRDLSGNGNDLVLKNFSFNKASGWVNGGLKCNGTTNYLALVDEDNFNLDTSKDVTIMLMTKGTTFTSSQSRCFIQTNTWGSGIHMVYYKSGELQLKIGGGSVIKKAVGLDSTGQNIVNLCIVKNNGNNRLYYNNELANTDASSFTFNKGKLRVMAGEGDSVGDYTDGTIYSVAIYNRTLTESEMTAIYNYQMSLIKN